MKPDTTIKQYLTTLARWDAAISQLPEEVWWEIIDAELAAFVIAPGLEALPEDQVFAALSEAQGTLFRPELGVPGWTGVSADSLARYIGENGLLMSGRRAAWRSWEQPGSGLLTAVRGDIARYVFGDDDLLWWMVQQGEALQRPMSAFLGRLSWRIPPVSEVAAPTTDEVVSHIRGHVASCRRVAVQVGDARALPSVLQRPVLEAIIDTVVSTTNPFRADPART